jgi:hypothetical protein
VKRATILAVASAAVLIAVSLHVGASSAAPPVALPDLRVYVPTNLISVGNDPSTGRRDLRFTHITADIGAGPFEIDPTYDPKTGTATFVQAIYSSPRPGVWRFDHDVPVGQTGVFRPPSDYQFPLTSFTLNKVGPGGAPGAVVATSPKRDYCITGDYRLSGIPNTPDQTAIPQSDCTDPTKPLGWSVGWGDEYDQTDAGQPIDLTGVPDGTYVLVGTVDPKRVLSESNYANDVTDTTLRIRGHTVTVLSQQTAGSPPTHPHPPPAPGPTAMIVNPTTGEVVSGTVPVAAQLSSRARHAVAQFFLDGRRLGRPVDHRPFAIRWDTRTARRGTHTLSVRITSGSKPARATVTVTVANPPPPMTCFVLQAHVSGRGADAVTTRPFHTAARDETLLAFVSADGPGGAAQRASVSGAGLRWVLVARADTLPGDAEVWAATAPSVLAHVTVTARLAVPGYSLLLSAIAVEGSDGVGATAVGSAGGGAPSVGLRTRSAASLVFAVGHDWDRAAARTLPDGWVPLDQWLDTQTGDTSWIQYTNATTGAAGSRVIVRDHAPVDDQWNLAAVELRGDKS